MMWLFYVIAMPHRTSLVIFCNWYIFIFSFMTVYLVVKILHRGRVPYFILLFLNEVCVHTCNKPSSNVLMLANGE